MAITVEMMNEARRWTPQLERKLQRCHRELRRASPTFSDNGGHIFPLACPVASPPALRGRMCPPVLDMFLMVPSAGVEPATYRLQMKNRVILLNIPEHHRMSPQINEVIEASSLGPMSEFTPPLPKTGPTENHPTAFPRSRSKPRRLRPPRGDQRHRLEQLAHLLDVGQAAMRCCYLIQTVGGGAGEGGGACGEA